MSPVMIAGDGILVDDLCLRRSAAGVAVYLRYMLRDWPAECSVKPVGYWAGQQLCEHQATASQQSELAGREVSCKTSPASTESLLSVVPALRPLRELRPPRNANALGMAAKGLARRAYAVAFARRAKAGRFAACFQPNHLAVATCLPTVTTMHDISVLDHPEWHPAERVRNWRSRLAESLRATTLWAADSRFTRDRMVQRLGVDPARIEVIPLAGRELLAAEPAEQQLATQRHRETEKRADADKTSPLCSSAPPCRIRSVSGLELPERYLLHLGTLEPRKNLPMLLDAYAALSQQIRSRCKLVLAGAAGWGGADFWRKLIEHPLAGEVLVTGYVSDAQAGLLLAGASAVLVPSRYEGFGLPVLEAMAAGVPVVCSTADALTEIAGGASEVLSPDDVKGWAGAMSLAVDDEAWRSLRISAGREQAKLYTWRETARRTADLLVRATRM